MSTLLTQTKIHGTLEERAVETGRLLADASQEFLDSLAVSVRTAPELAKAVGVTKDVATRFLAALAKRDPLAVIYYMPGVESLRRLSHGAKSRRGVSSVAIENFDVAIVVFEQFLREEVGGRHALDAIASSRLAEAREKFESTSRQMAYRAIANLRGVESETGIYTTLLHPNEHDDRLDLVELCGMAGLRRLRPSIPLLIAGFNHVCEGSTHMPRTITGRPILPTVELTNSPDELLSDFRRGGQDTIRAKRKGSSVDYELVAKTLGAGSEVDVFFGLYTPSLSYQWASKPDHVVHIATLVDMPIRRLIMDVLVHESVWQRIEPELLFFNISCRSPVLVQTIGELYAHENVRIDLLDSVRWIGTGIECCRVTELPQYVDMLQWTCKQRGWSPSGFRVYRCDSRYPLYGTQYSMLFRLPEKPVGVENPIREKNQ